jgi:hypothetical protein
VDWYKLVGWCKRDYPPPPAQARFPEKAPRGAGAPPGGTSSQSPAPRAPPAGALGGREQDTKPGEAGERSIYCKEPCLEEPAP